MILLNSMKKSLVKNKIIEATAPTIIKLMHRIHNPFAVILNYHRVNNYSEPWELSSIDTKTFKRQMLFLKENFSICNLDMLTSIKSRNKHSKPIVAITFDDGYRGFYDHALPVLRELDIEAALFLSTDAVDNRKLFWWDYVGFLLWNLKEPVNIDGFGNIRPENSRIKKCAFINYLKSIDNAVKQSIITQIEHSSDLQNIDKHVERLVMNWNHVKNVSVENVIIGAHTHMHPIIAKIDNLEFIKDTKTNIALIEKHINLTPRLFAYPNGNVCDYKKDTPEVLKALGITHAFTMDSKFININDFNSQGNYEISRFNASVSYTGFLTQISGIYSLINRS